MRGDYKYLIVFAACIIIAIAACFIFAWYQVDVSQHHWCTVLTTLTQHQIPKPGNAAANPSRVASYELYEEFVNLRGEFGCG